VAGLAAHAHALCETKLLRSLAAQLQSPLPELEKKTNALLTRTSSLEKTIASLYDAQAAATAKELLTKQQLLSEVPAIIERLPDTDGSCFL
jgi:alanyl-tRNA synthetase